MSLTNRLQELLTHRWLLIPLAVAIGLVSGWLLWVTLRRDYRDYWLFPRLKAGDFYIYPQARYTLFDIVLLPWCFSGLIVSGAWLWSVVSSHRVARWTYRFVILYFALFTVLILGGSIMLYVRSRG